MCVVCGFACGFRMRIEQRSFQIGKRMMKEEDKKEKKKWLGGGGGGTQA